MAEITKKELKEGKRQLEGVVILCWVVAIILGLGLIVNIGRAPFTIYSGLLRRTFDLSSAAAFSAGLVSFPTRIIYSLIAPALYIVELIGIYQRKSFAVPLGRAVLVVTMVFLFPVGTIVGAILWKRFKHPVSKKYLNYEG